MYHRNDFLTQLEQLGIDPKGSLKVHLSYKAIGDVFGQGETVLEALAHYMRDGLLVLPSHTWAHVNEKNPVMDMLHCPSNVGALTEVFRKWPGALRSAHPTHSVAALGRDAEAFVAGEETLQTPCGKGGCYYKLWEREAQILLIGVNFARNTFIHGIEEWDGAVGSISPNASDLYVITPDARRLYTPQYRHCASIGSETFPKLEPEAYAKGILRFGNFGNATARVMDTVPLRSFVAEKLKENPRHLLTY